MVHRFCTWRVAAVLAASLLIGSRQAAAGESTASAARGSTSRALGEAGQVVLQDLIGVRTSSAPNRAPYAASPPGMHEVGSLGDPGPSVSAAWLDVWTSRVGYDGGPSRVSRTMRFEPSADVFAAPRISLGGSVGAALGSFRNPGFSRSITAVALSADPRVGYLLPLGDVFALWPRVRAGITIDPTDGDLDSVGWRLGADLPLLVRVSTRVLLSCGPELTYAAYDAGNLAASQSLRVAGRGGLSLVL